MKTYSCPMHPEVRSDKPGKCPKCGMELTAKNSLHNKNSVTGNRSLDSKDIKVNKNDQ